MHKFDFESFFLVEGTPADENQQSPPRIPTSNLMGCGNFVKGS